MTTALTIGLAFYSSLASAVAYLVGYHRGLKHAYSDAARTLKERPWFSISPDGKSITCHVCGRTSWHPEDVRNKYCGGRHVFHDDREAKAFFAE